MARPLRLQYLGAFYHISSRGNERKAIFRSEADRKKFISYLESAHERYHALIHCYCLLDNHYHLLLETPRGNLSQILHHINGAYTTYFNVKRKRAGHLFQGRFRAILVEKEVYGQELSRYIHLNPLRAGMVENLADYPWSSYAYYVGMKKRPSWLETRMILGYFSENEHRAHGKYQAYLEEASHTPIRNPLKEVFASTFLGNQRFIDGVSQKKPIPKDSDIRNIPALRVLTQRPSLGEIRAQAELVVGDQGRLLRKFGVFISHQYGGYSLKEVGSLYGMKEAAVSQASRRFKQEVQEKASIKSLCKKIIQNLTLLNVET